MIGATARNSDLAHHPLVRERYAALSQAILAGVSSKAIYLNQYMYVLLAVGLPAVHRYSIQDLWTGTSRSSTGALAASVPAQSTVLLRVGIE